MIMLITGGAKSGKSSFGEALYKDNLDVVYIATSGNSDREMEEKIKAHRANRPKEWRTYEGNYKLYNSIGKEKNYILDCITVLASNIMFDLSRDAEYISFNLQKEIVHTVLNEIRDLINVIRERGYNLVLITNEVGSSIVPEHHISRVFRDIQGKINQEVATLSDEVYLVCCGIPVKIK
ncbi:MAG TPA: bifunctional adenosylcobinamide kinase/adenosylcobinamide-phosphate guanylyltransferase [Clostridia bacterium]|nr:bifunctional adenosylcobinamide kinase/adenosylcobinamide-phosphate guanylyltransferase [Clostridia bacterium]